MTVHVNTHEVTPEQIAALEAKGITVEPMTIPDPALRRFADWCLHYARQIEREKPPAKVIAETIRARYQEMKAK